MVGITLDAFAVGYIFGKLIFWGFIIFVIVLIFRMIIRSSSSENNVLNNLQNTKKEENETITHSPTSEPKKEVLPIDLKHFEFVSDNHIRYNNDVKSDADNRGACRGILIESSNNEIFMVSIHNLKKENPIFGNIQMSPKAMKIVRQDKDSIELRGYGHDEIGASFSDYGMILHLSDNTIQKITLIMWDRNARIEYLKVEKKNELNFEDMGTKKEKLLSLFSKTVMEEVKLLKGSQDKTKTIATGEIKLRLFKTDEGTINLEFLTKDEGGLYYKPIGFYFFETTFLKSIHILKEFEESYDKIKTLLPLEITQLVKFLTDEENAYIAIVSREVINIVRKMFNNPLLGRTGPLLQVQEIKNNDLNIIIHSFMMGALEAKVEDDENDIFVMFQKRGNDISIHCTEPLYYNLIEKSLLTALKD